MISGFTFIHNGVHGGYPFVESIRAVKPFVDEMVVVDMASTDETRQVLEKLEDISIIDGLWEPGTAGECLKKAHALHTRCKGDTIWHFEADEVCDSRLAFALQNAIRVDGIKHALMWRLQVSQNFQRIRWYPELVHRVFPNDGSIEKCGHTTTKHATHELPEPDPHTWAYITPGFLWDVTNCFRDDWLNRIRQQQELWGNGDDTHTLYVPQHATHCEYVPIDCVGILLEQPHWTWTRSPLDVPDVLKSLIGKVSYKETLKCRQLIS